MRALGWDFCCPQHFGAAVCGLGWELLGPGNYLLPAVGAEGGLCCTTQLFAAPLYEAFLSSMCTDTMLGNWGYCFLFC